MNIKKNDTVLVLTGKDHGTTAKVLVAMPKTNKVVVDGVNIQMKHAKARSANQTSEIKKQAGPIDASNVMVVCPACNKATRVAYKTEGDKKFRVCKKCGAPLDVEVKKEVKKTTRKTTAKKAVDGAEAPAKKPSTRKKTVKAEVATEETNA